MSFFDPKLNIVQRLQPGDEILRSGRWLEVMHLTITDFGLMIETYDEADNKTRTFLSNPMHIHRVRQQKPTKPTVSKGT